MHKVAICDDREADRQYIAALTAQWAKEHAVSLQTDVFPSAEAFLFHYAEHKDYVVLLLDIEMGSMDGVTLAKHIRSENEGVQIVFITGYSDYIAEGYEVAALHYLMKPVQQEKLFAVLDRAFEKAKRNERVLTLESGGEMARIPLYEVRYLEVLKNYVTVHARREYTVKKTLSECEALLDERFFRIGRSYIVNLTAVQRVTKTDVYLSGGAAIPLPRGAYEALNRALIARI